LRAIAISPSFNFQAFNRMTETIGDRERMVGLTNLPVIFASNDGDRIDNSTWQNIPSRLTLHRLVWI
jgi:hypothetical protein